MDPNTLSIVLYGPIGDRTDIIASTWTASGPVVQGGPRDSRLVFGGQYRVEVRAETRALSGVAAEPHQLRFTAQNVGTLVSADITGDTTFTPAGSPYLFDSSKVLYLNEATLTVEPGVEVYGAIRLLGGAKVVANGTESSPSFFGDGAFILNSSYSPSTSVFSHCVFDRFLPMSSLSTTVRPSARIDHSRIDLPERPVHVDAIFEIGAGSITNSRLTVRGQGVRAVGGVLERNVIVVRASSFTAKLGDGWASFSRIQNNYFDLSGAGAATKPYLFGVVDAAAGGTLRGNTFAGARDNAITVQTWAQPGTLDLSGNYWGTTDPVALGGKVFDKEDDSQRAISVTMTPALEQPAAETPVP